jgi:hypothetical protein
MPNWCVNNVYIETTPEEIAAIVAAIENQDDDKGLLHYLCPEPEHVENDTSGVMPNWYNWRVANWGTKWEVQAEITSHSVEGGWINLFFDSAWSPPIEALDYWASQGENRQFNVRYIEWGAAFCGEADNSGNTTYNIPTKAADVKATIPAELDEEFDISYTVAQWEHEEAEETTDA